MHVMRPSERYGMNLIGETRKNTHTSGARLYDMSDMILTK